MFYNNFKKDNCLLLLHLTSFYNIKKFFRIKFHCIFASLNPNYVLELCNEG